ncbi:23S rRNA (cytidine1920-2'-O)/16S rRNA (cytidine1409-2'-O)-methyltransferase [Gracilibacillus ureilyticus]|uniref:23S rRNA (Cytidine1920-2'-O)/16S rRNA (Cytidine1409-2'-O)-methyltransferase n=1 Tax=Gracilibacillus ureilyticus TaxID=531814 RepID=A0A1H9LX83_9BACI|nr:TlyA family RNA methyltransferase [Gracilibacillus ureilyticus]SER15795.1 23S rRNA (cytidine1920-2'-O)/16S rRNA (cytidine1409-2'-O)-methyltransferase [Gracilibacillus ureilyticus]
MSKKIRLDQLIVDRGLIETREKAKRTIMAGLVFSKGIRLEKPGTKVDDDIPLEVKGKLIPYVGRGGLKLEKALKFFNISLDNRIMVDVGSSTGGFTDCGLQNGVKLSYAIDVGYNQLDWKLRNDPRVVVMERTNFRHVTPDMLKYETPDFATVDVSFISLRLILEPLYNILSEQSDCIILIKPQFEAGRDQVGKKGIVRDPDVHKQVGVNILTFAKNIGFSISGLTFSPITGGDGNIEFLAWLKKGSHSNKHENLPEEVDRVVTEAHQELTNK